MKKSLYQIIRDVVKEIRQGSKTYQQMLDTLTQADLDKEAARKILDRLVEQEEEEDFQLDEDLFIDDDEAQDLWEEE